MNTQLKDQAANLYTSTDCHNRVSQVQKLCDSMNLGGILFIAGMDGRDNVGSMKAINYLFSGISAHDLQSSIIYQEKFDDLTVLVRNNFRLAN